MSNPKFVPEKHDTANHNQAPPGNDGLVGSGTSRKFFLNVSWGYFNLLGADYPDINQWMMREATF